MIYSGHAFFIVDAQWPDKYASTMIRRVQPDFIVLLNDEVVRSEQIHQQTTKTSESTRFAHVLLDQCGYQHIIDKPQHIVLQRCSQLEKTESIADGDLAYVIATSGSIIDNTLNSCTNAAIKQLNIDAFNGLI